jgi:hypothetical protein
MFEAARRLEEDGLVQLRGDTCRTTRRWQAAMARAAFRLYGEHSEAEDLRVPIVLALLEIYGDAVGDDDMASLVEAILPIERAELDPSRHLGRDVVRPVT